MANTASNNKLVQIVLAVVVLGAVFAAGYYFSQKKDTTIDINLGGKNFSATIDQ